MSLSNNKENDFSFQTSQDPSSPNAAEPSPSTSNNLAAANLLDLRDGWDNEEWGSLEEEPVRRFSYKISEFISLIVDIVYRMKNLLTLKKIYLKTRRANLPIIITLARLRTIRTQIGIMTHGLMVNLNQLMRRHLQVTILLTILADHTIQVKYIDKYQPIS